MIKEYHHPDGNPVSVNLAAIAYVQGIADQTAHHCHNWRNAGGSGALRRGFRCEHARPASRL